MEFRSLNLGTGAVDEKHAQEWVIGRGKLVGAFWAAVSSDSIRLLAERRMGKTWVLKLALALRHEGADAVFLDVEGLDSAEDFVLRLTRALHDKNLVSDKWYGELTDRFRNLGRRLQGQEVAGLKIPVLDSWESHLEATLRHFVEHSGERKAVVLVDELPLFLDKLVVKADGRQEAIQFLDTCRALRQALPNLRMVFCGSLGLHIVLGKLHDAGYTGKPVNDMPPFEVPPLDPADAGYLAGCLLLGKQIACNDIGKVADSVAEAASCVPFYIVRMVNWMADQPDARWTPKRAASVVQDLFDAPGDPAELSYYDTRLDQYYPEGVVEKARAALDVVSQEPKGVPFNRIVNLVRHRPKTLTVDAEEIRNVLGTLRDDHYLVPSKDRWRFKLELVRRWWYETRGRLAL